jgi:hypothetical protein
LPGIFLFYHMKLRRYLPLLVLLCISVVLYAGTGTPPAPDDDFSLFLLLLATVAVCAFVGVAIVGALMAALFFIAFSIMVFSGIISVSVLAGWYRKSAMRGVRVFVYLSAASLCGCLAAGVSVLAGCLFHWGNIGLLLLLGGIGGAAGGLVLSRVILRALHITYRFVVMRNGQQS